MLVETFEMYKVKPVYHAGQAIVQLSELPGIQYEFMVRHIAPDNLVNVIIEDGDAELCIRYEDYEHYYRLLHPVNFELYFDSQL